MGMQHCNNLPGGVQFPLFFFGTALRDAAYKVSSPSLDSVLIDVHQPMYRSITSTLYVHMQILDLMGYPPSHENKINIHVGGTYGDKDETLQRFAANFRRLSPACQKRLTVENDDIPSLFSMEDLLPLHQMTGIPLVRSHCTLQTRPVGLWDRSLRSSSLLQNSLLCSRLDSC